MEPNEAEAKPSSIQIGAINGDLHVRIWAGEAESPARARLIDDEGVVVPLDGSNAPTVRGDATLLVADKADVSIRRVDGDLTVSGLPGALHIETVNGDAVLQNVAGAVVLGRAQGDVTALGLGDALTIVMATGDVTVDGVRGTVRLNDVQGDLNLRAAAKVELSSIAGDLRGQDATEIAVEGTIQGDVTLAHMDRCTLRSVGGDLTALDIRELLQVPSVDGDVRLRNTGGQVRLAQVGGDLAAQDLMGGIMAEAGGEAYLETPLVAGMTYHVVAEGIVLRARSPINAQFVATTEEGEVRTHLPLTVERHRQHLVGVIGTGDAMVTLSSASGDILVDAAGTEHAGDEGTHRRKGNFYVHVDTGHGGPNIHVDGEGIADMIQRELASAWPFTGGFSMTNPDNTPRDTADIESQMRELGDQMRDLGERTSRAARKAAERVRERARSADWEAVRRDVRNAIERTVGELDSFFKEITAEFDRPTGSTVDGTADAKKSGPTAQRIVIERDDVAAQPTVTKDGADDSSVKTPDDDRAARRRAILEQVRFGDLSLEEAERRLNEL